MSIVLDQDIFETKDRSSNKGALRLIPMNDTTNLNRQIDYLVANLIEFFRDPRAEMRYLEAAKIALNQMDRAGVKENLEKRFTFFASRLRNNLNHLSIRHFAKECVESSYKTETEPKKAPDPQRMLKRRAYKEVAEALSLGYSQTSALNRAAHFLAKEKQRQSLEEKKAKIVANHPLNHALTALNSLNSRVPKEDIRNHLLNLNRNESSSKEGKLFGLLKKAQAFSAPKMHALIGDELFFLCKPLGFLDKNDQTLLVEVPTSAHLHALTYRKLELLMALKKDETFRLAKNIRFKVAYGSF